MENMHTDDRDENLVFFFFFYRSLCAFLNSGKCGTVYLGIHKDGIVAGLKINKKQVCLRVFSASQSSQKKTFNLFKLVCCKIVKVLPSMV